MVLYTVIELHICICWCNSWTVKHLWFQQRNLLWIPILSKCGHCQPMTWMMMMWWVMDVYWDTLSHDHNAPYTDFLFRLSCTCLSVNCTLSLYWVFLVPSVPLPCRIWWILMLCWMKRTWRSQTQYLLKPPHVEKEPPRRKPARTGELTTQMFSNHSVIDCSSNRRSWPFKQVTFGHLSVLWKRLHDVQYVACLCSTCGLAEELEQDSKAKQKTNLPKSSCGSVSMFWLVYILTMVTHTGFPLLSC